MLTEKANCSSLPVQSRTRFLKVKERFPAFWDSITQSYQYSDRKVSKFIWISRRHRFCICKREIECVSKFDLVSILPSNAEVCGETQDMNPVFLNWDFSHKPVFTLYIKNLFCFSSPPFPFHFMRATAFFKMDLSRSRTRSRSSTRAVALVLLLETFLVQTCIIYAWYGRIYMVENAAAWCK